MEKNEKKISKWIEKTINKKLYLEYYDLHVDEINDYSDNNYWLEEGLKYLEMSKTLLIQKNHTNYNIMLAIPLKSKETITGINFQNFMELKKELDITPPSLYIFKNSENPWDSLKVVKIDFSDSTLTGIDFYYIEYKEDNDFEYRRAIWAALQETREK